MRSWKTTLPFALWIAMTACGCTNGSEEKPAESAAPAAKEEAAPEAPAPANDAEAAKPAGQPAAQPAAEAAATEWIIWADGDPWDGPAPLEIEFECDLMEEVPDPKFEWDFGDGSPKSADSHPKHVYEKPGQYTAVCRVTDPSGGVGEDSVVIDVDPAE